MTCALGNLQCPAEKRSMNELQSPDLLSSAGLDVLFFMGDDAGSSFLVPLNQLEFQHYYL